MLSIESPGELITKQLLKDTGLLFPKPDITEPPGIIYLKFLNKLKISSSVKYLKVFP